jgi:hypothetical protein
MAYRDEADPSYDDIITRSAPSQGTTPWWKGPPPPGYTGIWPPPLQPGQSYGPNFGQIDGGGGTFDPAKPAGGTGAYDPSAWGNAATPSPPVTGQGGSSGNAAMLAGQNFQFPQFTPPPYQGGAPFNAPGPFSFAPFSYADFKAPTAEDAAQNPGYQFALDQGRKALESSAAAKGVLRTGGTLKDLFSWGNQFGERNYNDVFGRDLTTYGTNRANAFGEWSANRDNAAGNFATNYGVTRDSFDRGETQRNTQNEWNYRGATDTFNPLFRGSELKFADLYNRWRDQLASLTDLARPPA